MAKKSNYLIWMDGQSDPNYRKAQLFKNSLYLKSVFCIPSCYLIFYKRDWRWALKRRKASKSWELHGRIVVLVETVLLKKRKNFKQKVIVSCLNTVMSNLKTVLCYCYFLMSAKYCYTSYQYRVSQKKLGLVLQSGQF